MTGTTDGRVRGRHIDEAYQKAAHDRAAYEKATTTTLEECVNCQGPPESQPEVKRQRDYLFETLATVNQNLYVLGEALGYVSTPTPEERCAPCSIGTIATRSPLAHDLLCAAENARNVAAKIFALTEALEI
jgi:hypothetical protein